MKQLNEEQAVAMYESKEWSGWTYENVVKFQLYQERLCIDFNLFHRAIEHVLGRPVFTHEFASQKNLIEEYEGTRPAPTFEDIVNLLPNAVLVMLGE